MDRRDFLTKSALGVTAIAAAAGLASCDQGSEESANSGTPAQPSDAPSVNTGLQEWKLVTTWPKNFPGLGTGAQRLADSITAMSGGRLIVKLYAAGELVPAFESFDAVREGNAQMSHDASYYWVAKNKSTPFFCTVPGGLTAQEHAAWIHFGGGQALWDELYAEFGLRAFLAGGSGVQMGGWFQREINGLSDINGIKMRIPGFGAEVINRLGGTAVNLPGGEIMPALQAGTIDATEWVGPWNDLAFGFHKVAKYYYGPGFHEPSSALECMINLDAWNSLDSELQDIVRHACSAEYPRTLAEFTAGNGEAQRVLVGDHGVSISNFPADVIKAAFEAANDVVAETANEGELNKRIYESWSTFRADAMDRGPYAEQGYMNNRALL